MRILIIEDEFKLADIIKDRLKKEKYIVDIKENGLDGLDEALTGIYDLIILDIMLPKKDGISILKELKEKKIDSKVILLTAKSLLDDKLEGFKYGADDYLTKPFHMEELVARVNVQLRKENVIDLDYIKFSDLKLNIRTSKLICINTNESIDIILKEFLLLEYFMKNANQILSKEQIYDKVWGINNEAESNNLEAYLSFIRKKLKIIGSKVNIKVVRGLGYKMVIEHEETKE